MSKPKSHGSLGDLPRHHGFYRIAKRKIRSKGKVMKTEYESQREDQLRRKLNLYLGSQNDWLAAYGAWCAENNVDGEQVYAQHNITIFVKQQRKEKRHAKS
jgi:hypothetical protein